MAVQTNSRAGVVAEPAAPDRLNGFDIRTLGAAFEALKERRDGGRATFFSRSRWQDGAPGVTTRLAGYEFDGELLHGDAREHFVRCDEFVELGSTATAPAPGELLMAALGGCITATARAYAAFKGVRLTRCEVAVESDVDLHGMFGLAPNVRPGMSAIRTTIRIAGEGDDESLREIALLGYQFSPVRNSIGDGVPITPNVEVGP